jgi:hypothetical protein
MTKMVGLQNGLQLITVAYVHNGNFKVHIFRWKNCIGTKERAVTTLQIGSFDSQ